MERLSERLQDVVHECIDAWSQVEEDIVTAAIKRLAAYEDTGLEPEELQLGLNAAVRKKVGAEYYGLTPDQMDRAVDLFKANAEGRFVVLPCKVGDTVYCILEDSPVYYPDTDGWYISEETVHEITTKGLILHEIENGEGVYVESFDQVGKTVFLTREEAEKALKGGAGDAVT